MIGPNLMLSLAVLMPLLLIWPFLKRCQLTRVLGAGPVHTGMSWMTMVANGRWFDHRETPYTSITWDTQLLPTQQCSCHPGVLVNGRVECRNRQRKPRRHHRLSAFWTGFGPTSIQDIGIASGGGPLRQLSLALHVIPLTSLLSCMVCAVLCVFLQVWSLGPVR